MLCYVMFYYLILFYSFPLHFIPFLFFPTHLILIAHFLSLFYSYFIFLTVLACFSDPKMQSKDENDDDGKTQFYFYFCLFLMYILYCNSIRTLFNMYDVKMSVINYYDILYFFYSLIVFLTLSQY